MKENEYSSQRTAQLKSLGTDDLIEENRDFAEMITRKIMRNLMIPDNLYSDLVSGAYLGLVEAANRFKPSQDIRFRHYAFLRVRGGVSRCTQTDLDCISTEL